MITDVIAGREPWWVETGDCLTVLPSLPPACVDAVVTDPPYPEIDRAYGRLTESQWWDLMMVVCREVRRILKPTGSAVFILQPNSRKVGSMRGWLFRFQAWVCDNWNMVQDAYWWNHAAMPCLHTASRHGLMRPSLKAVVWAGNPNCYRNQLAVLWSESEANVALRANARSGRKAFPSGQSVNEEQISSAAVNRGGVTPFNVLPVANTNSTSSAGSHNHGAGTPIDVCHWWTRYICPVNGILLDPFAGSGTQGLAARLLTRRFIGIEKDADYAAIARSRIAAATPLDDACFKAAAKAEPPGLFDALESPS